MGVEFIGPDRRQPPWRRRVGLSVHRVVARSPRSEQPVSAAVAAAAPSARRKRSDRSDESAAGAKRAARRARRPQSSDWCAHERYASGIAPYDSLSGTALTLWIRRHTPPPLCGPASHRTHHAPSAGNRSWAFSS
ncbi:hypothetical protein MTO96_016525 [Rhipicephalus appendiculatus]